MFSTNQLLYCSQNQNNTYVLALNEYGALSRKENPAQYGKFGKSKIELDLFGQNKLLSLLLWMQLTTLS